MMEVLWVLLGFLTVISIPFIYLYLRFSRWWHRLRKYKYRLVQATVVSSYGDDPRTYWVIQKKGWFGWRDNPEIPGYCPSDGKFHIWHSYYYSSREEGEKWMDRISAVMVADGEKRTVV